MVTVNRPDNTLSESGHPKTRAIIHELCEKRSDNDSSVAASRDRTKARELRAAEFPGPTTLCLDTEKEARLEGWLSKLPGRETLYITASQIRQEGQIWRRDQWKEELEATEGRPRYEWIDDESYIISNQV